MDKVNEYYWAKTYEGEWIIVLHSCGYYYCAGHLTPFLEESFAEIGRKVLDFGPNADNGTRH